MKTHFCNCILTFNSGPQAFLDLRIPLEAGEDVCRILFEAVAETMRPTLPVTLKTGDPLTDERIPKREVLSIDQAKQNQLCKVSMCVLEDDTDASLSWFRLCHGKLYYR